MNFDAMIRRGIDPAKGLARYFHDEKLYGSVLRMFLADDTFSRAKAAHEAGDMDALFRCAHELKGVSGSAALNELYDYASAMVECLRPGSGDGVGVDPLFSAMEAAYNKACEGVTAGLAD